VNAVEATKYLMDLARVEKDVRIAVMSMAARAGYSDLPSWGAAECDIVIMVAESFKDTYGQFEKFDSMLAAGDIS
jgi:hypothetical protein